MKFIGVLFFTICSGLSSAQNVFLNFSGPDRIGYSWVNEVHDADVFIMDKDLKKVGRLINTPRIYHSNFTPVPLVMFPGDVLDIAFANKQVTITSRNNPVRNYEQRCTRQMAAEYGELVFMDFNSADNVRLPDVKHDFSQTDKKYFTQTGKHLNKPPRSLAERDSLLYAAYKGRLAILDDYDKKYGLTGEYMRFMSEVALYRYLYFSLLGYKLLNDPVLSSNLRKYIADPALQNDSLIAKVNMYRAFYLTLNRYRTQLAKGVDASPTAEIEMAAATLNGKTKDNVVMSVAHAELQKKKAEPGLLTVFYRNCTDTAYAKKIGGMTLVFEKSPLSQTTLVGLDNKKSSFEDLLKSKNGKIVVIDFWASWCAPCLKELPLYRSLIPKLNGKPVEFIFISIDDDAGNWKRSAASYRDFMNDQNSFVVVNGSTSPLSKKYSISTIPRMMIFNRKGEAAQLNAPRPSDPGLLRLLLNELQKL